MKRLTPKQRVLRKYPKAVAWTIQSAGHWYISTPDWAGRDLSKGFNFTAAQAWADAARRLGRGKRNGR